MGVYAGAFLIVYISELTGQRQCVFLLVKRFPRPAASLLWWTLAPMTTCHRHGRPASTSQRDTAPRPLTHHRHWKARRSRTVRLRSLVSPSVRSGRDVPPRPDLPPSGAQSLRRTDRPRVQRATGNGCPVALVYSCAIHVATDTGTN
ncbi:hypothetical protein SAMN05216584_102212 [Selenomonas sp. WCT3]|nr:hypothetical protein SAMN05216584_102212 [Selenomonas ruminantium]